jgi:hypothetical protein
MKKLSKKERQSRRDHERTVLTFDVEFTGMTEEDFAFLRQYAERLKAEKEASGAIQKAC